MSDRSTISVYHEGEIVGFRCYTNWLHDSVLVECMDMVAMIGDATSRADILCRLGWDPAEDADTAGILRSVYMLTDFDAVIDASRRCVFWKSRSETLEDAESSREIITTPEAYDEAREKYDEWAGADLISFDVLPHVREALDGTVRNGEQVATEQEHFVHDIFPTLFARALGAGSGQSQSGAATAEPTDAAEVDSLALVDFTLIWDESSRALEELDGANSEQPCPPDAITND